MDYLDNAKNELRRAEHLLYVSLKYTRTVDVIRSIIERLINSLDNGIDALLEKVKRRRKTLEIPNTPRQKSELVKELYSKNEKIVKMMDFYLRLRDILQAKYSRREEYRRHVTMVSNVGGEIVEVKIDTLHEYYDKVKEFIELVQEEVK